MGKSQKLYKKAKRLIPGGTQLLSKRPEMFLPELWPAYYEEAKGCEAWDLDGNKFLDMSFMGIGSCILGYADKDVNNAVKKIIDKGSMSTLNAPEEVELAKLLIKLHPWAGMVRYARSGGEAMTVAVRIARVASKKDTVLFCYDDKTEILTKNGFKKFEDLREEEIVATLNPHNNQLEYKQIQKRIKYHFVGKMIHFMGQRVDLMVTPEHMIYRKFPQKKGYNFKLAEAGKHLKKKTMVQMTSVCDWEGKAADKLVIPGIMNQTRPTKNICSFDMKDFIRFMGWYLSEGSCTEQKRGRYEVCITQDEKNVNNSNEIITVIKKLGFTPYRNGHHICFNSKELVKYLRQFGKCEDRYIPDWIRDLSPEYLAMFVDSMIKGDGTFEKGGIRKFYSTSTKLIDGMQELLLKLGYSTTISERMNNGFSHHKIYCLYISNEKFLGCRSKEENYNGYVYCVTVPNHIILVRRKGKIVWSGNCGYHGWHDWYLAANLSSKKALKGHLLPGLNPKGVPQKLKGTAFPFKYNDTEGFLELLEKHKRKTGVVVLETIRNFYPRKEFLDAIVKKTRKYGIILILDEITSGFRLNLGGAHLLFKLEPDIAVFAKGMSNGFPMAAVIGKKSVMEVAQDSFISSTYWTDRIGPVAALATIKKLQANNVPGHLIIIGKKVKQGWSDLSAKHKIEIEIGGIDPLGHFSFKHSKPLVLKTLFTQLMLEKGFLATNAFYASFAHKGEHIKKYLGALDDSFSFIAKAIKERNPEKYLKGSVCHSGFKRLT